MKQPKKGLSAKISPAQTSTKFRRAREISAGFTVIEGSLIVVILAIIGGTGYYVWHSKQQADNVYNSASQSQKNVALVPIIKTFAECQKASGSKIQETFPEVCVTNGGKSFTNDAQIALNTMVSKLPKALQQAILAQTKKDAPACVKDNQTVDYNGKPVDNSATYEPSGFAITGIGCDGGAAHLFIYQSGSWKDVGVTQSGWSCEVVDKYKVPSSVISDCFDKDGNSRQVTY